MRSCFPKRFEDDGTNVSVDVHGCTVDDALYVIRRTLQEACWRGRSSVTVIHGSSTTDPAGATRTIKSELERSLNAGAFSDWVTGALWNSSGGSCRLALPLSGTKNPSRIKVSDVVPR